MRGNRALGGEILPLIVTGAHEGDLCPIGRPNGVAVLSQRHEQRGGGVGGRRVHAAVDRCAVDLRILHMEEPSTVGGEPTRGGLGYPPGGSRGGSRDGPDFTDPTRRVTALVSVLTFEVRRVTADVGQHRTVRG